MVVSLPGNRFNEADADKEGGGEGEKDSPSIEANASIG
jgi:hypothetical protein